MRTNRVAITDATQSDLVYTTAQLIKDLGAATETAINGLVRAGMLRCSEYDANGNRYWPKSDVDPYKNELRAEVQRRRNKSGR